VNSLRLQPWDNVVFYDIVYPSTPVIYRRLENVTVQFNPLLFLRSE
jgi:hypothetical protein